MTLASTPRKFRGIGDDASFAPPLGPPATGVIGWQAGDIISCPAGQVAGWRDRTIKTAFWPQSPQKPTAADVCCGIPYIIFNGQKLNQDQAKAAQVSGQINALNFNDIVAGLDCADSGATSPSAPSSSATNPGLYIGLGLLAVAFIVAVSL